MLRFLFNSILVLALVGLLAVGALLKYLTARLPEVDSLREVRLQEPLRIYTADGDLIAEFGEKRREPVTFQEVPDALVKAFVAAEDDQFFRHRGVDWTAILGALINELQTGGERSRGGSTITMQVARNFFLTREKTYARKLNEILLALKIERELSKQEILELYLNKIYLGHRAYGVAAASKVYYGVGLDELSLAQVAMIAGLPQAPSRQNPITSPESAKQRRAYVLRRMIKMGYINRATYDQAIAEPVSAHLFVTQPDVVAPHVAEMVRRNMLERYGDDAYQAGLQVHTTVKSALQEAANAALRKGLLEFDRRHGYRGAEQQLVLTQGALEPAALDGVLRDFAVVNGLLPAVVVAIGDQQATVYNSTHGRLVVPWKGLSWARRYIDQNRMGAAPKRTSDILKVGDIVRISPDAEGGWALTQLPAVEGALVALRPEDGALLALTGGFDFYQSKFNRVTQARRQPGSSFKPFIYSAALEHGFTAASFVNDAPLVFEGGGYGDGWRPENYSGRYHGPTRLRNALAKSRNLVSIRLMQTIGIGNALVHIAKFGFSPDTLPHDLSLSLGSGALTPLELARGYAVFANGGYATQPYFIERILDAEGKVLEQAQPARLCRDCELAAVGVNPDTMDLPANHPALVIDPQNAWLMTSMMQDVIRSGTGAKARSLNRKDLSGKTGTTNDQKDAWFSGFNTRLVATAWVGFDDAQPLGRRETGAQAALPIWIEFMSEALKGMPESPLEQPPGLVTVRIDPDTGMLAGAGNKRAIFEAFRPDNVPGQTAEMPIFVPSPRTSSSDIPEQLF